MADADSTPSNPLLIDEARGRIALQATWEIESISLLMREMIDNETEIKFLAFRGLAMRLQKLNAVVMSAVGDDLSTNAKLQESLGFNVFEVGNHG